MIFGLISIVIDAVVECWNEIVNWVSDLFAKLKRVWRQVVFKAKVIAKGLVKFIEKYYYQQKNSNKWMEQTTTREIPEDEVPPHIRKIMQRGDKKELEELVGDLMEVIGGTLESVGKALESAGEIGKISKKIEDDIPPRILRTLRLEFFKICENMYSAMMPLLIIAEGGETENTEELEEMLSEVREARKSLEG